MLAEAGEMDKFAEELRVQTGFNPTSQGMVAIQICFQKFLEMSINSEVYALEFAATAGLVDHIVHTTAFDQPDGLPITQVKFGVGSLDFPQRLPSVVRRSSPRTGRPAAKGFVHYCQPSRIRWAQKDPMGTWSRTPLTSCTSSKVDWRPNWFDSPSSQIISDN